MKKERALDTVKKGVVAISESFFFFADDGAWLFGVGCWLCTATTRT